MGYLGIDGCKGGWCGVYIVGDETKLLIEKTIDLVLAPLNDIKSVLIDIPIGLGSADVIRDLDSVARKLIKPKQTSSIFTPPIREALGADSYKNACAINAKISGKKISIQSWNITRKIIEVEKYLTNKSQSRRILHEAHPEICFKYLNCGKALTYKKRSPGYLGINERLKILSRFHPKSLQIFRSTIKHVSSKLAQVDDIVDALCLAVVCKLGFELGYEKLQGNTLKDERNIDMYMYYFDPRKHDLVQKIV